MGDRARRERRLHPTGTDGGVRRDDRREPRAFGYVLKQIPISTAYAVWTGTGAALTVLWGMATGAEPVTVLRVLFIAGIVGCVVGLKLVPARPPAAAPSRDVADATERRG